MSSHARVALAALFIAAAPAHAARRVYGSSLRAPATIARANGADSAFWPAAIRGHGPGAPVRGQILAIRLKGTALRPAGAPDPLNEIHFQHLVRRANGTMFVAQTSQPFRTPIGGRRNQVTTFRPENLCVARGDVIAFNDEGGFAPPWYSNGVPFRVFGSVRGSSTAQYTADNQTNNGATFNGGRVRHHEELLMQLVLGTGPDLGVPCRNYLHAAH